MKLTSQKRWLIKTNIESLSKQVTALDQMAKKLKDEHLPEGTPQRVIDAVNEVIDHSHEAHRELKAALREVEQ